MQLSTKRRVAFGLGTVGLTAGGLLAAGFGLAGAQADSIASGDSAGSPGVLSGNLVQIPVNVPVNVCGNQATVIGALNSVVGNDCENGGGSAAGGPGNNAAAAGGAQDSPGVLAGNLVQAPINLPVNACGNQVDVAGVGDTDAGNSCENGAGSDQPSANTANASGDTAGSPGVGSGNNVKVPVNAPVNACGNQVTVIGALNNVVGNDCANGGAGSTAGGGGSTPGTPGTPGTSGCGCAPSTPPTGPSTPGSPSTPSTPQTPSSNTAAGSASNGANGGGSLAETGSGILAAVPFAGGLLGGGTLLARKFAPRS